MSSRPSVDEIVKMGYTYWPNDKVKPDDWDGGEVLWHGAGSTYKRAPQWGIFNPYTIIGYKRRKYPDDATTWLKEGRALQSAGLLPDGVVLPDPEPDWEAWRPALDAFYTCLGTTIRASDPLDSADRNNVRALIAAQPHMPKEN